MTIEDLIGRTDALAQEIEGQIQKDLEITAVTGLAVLIQRVTETGKDAQGSAFKPYTPEYERYKRFAVGGIAKEGAKKKAQRKVKVATPDKPVGRYRGIVDFTLTGDMLSSTGIDSNGASKFRNIGIIRKEKEGGSFVVVIGARDDFNREKMIGNDNYRPKWFTLSVEEQQRLAGQSAERMTAFANTFINQA